MRGNHFITLAASVLATAAHAQPRATPAPQTTSSTPAAARPGTATEVSFSNAPAGEPVGLWTSFPAEIAPIPSDGKGPATARYRLTLPPETPVGIGAVRAATTGGLASLQFFLVDDLPTLPTGPAGRTPADARAIDTLGAVDGAATALASDHFRFTARRGQRIAFDVVAQRLGSRMDPLVRLLDSARREVAYVDDTPGLGGDARFAHVFNQGGEYVLELRDANYEGSADHRYRLRVGDFPTVVAAFPLAGKRGTESTFEFVGPDGDGVEPVRLPLPGDAPRASFGVRYPNGKSSAFVSVLCGPHDEFTAPSPNHSPATAARLTLPASVSGRFDAPGQRHYYEVEARKGDRLSARAQSRRWNSPVDASFQLFKLDGAKIAESKFIEPKPPTKGALPPPPDEGALEVAIPANGVYRLAVEDLNQSGGPAALYHFDLDRAGPDLALSTESDKADVAAGGTFRLKVKVERLGYGGPITFSARCPGVPLNVKNPTLAAGKAEGDLEVIVPADAKPTAAPLHFTLVGAGTGESAPERTVSTSPVLRRLFPRTLFLPTEFDGQIGLRIRPADAPKDRAAAAK